jgi:threonyl-tRNA synthetase
MILAGSTDVEAGAVSFRYRDGTQRNAIPVDQAVTEIVSWIADRANSSPTEASFGS